MKDSIILETEALEVAKQSSKSPLIFERPFHEGRRILEEAQNSSICMFPANIQFFSFDTKIHGCIPVYTVLPPYYLKVRNVIFYIHGGGWVFGSFHTHEKLVRELAYRTNSIVIFPEYTRSPEAKFPTAIEQCYYILTQLNTILSSLHIIRNLSTLTVAGDSVRWKYGNCNGFSF